jgi:protein-tyrosine phosphatase
MDGLAVGGCFPADCAPVLARDHEIRAVVDMRAEDCDDAEALGKADLRFLHLPTPDLHPVSPEMLDRGVEFAGQHLDRAERVLIHCQHGIGRSAMLALCVMVERGLEPLPALRQAKQRRMRVSPSPEQFEGWATWLCGRGHVPPRYDAFAQVAYSHLR